MNAKNTITKTSSTRVDLCGGTLDLWPLSVLVEGAKTYNVSLSCKTKVSYRAKEVKGISVLVKSPDFETKNTFKTLSEFYKTQDARLSLLQESFKAFLGVNSKVDVSGHWQLESESPAGSGLGGSSSLLISLIKVLSDVFGLSLDEPQMVMWAKNIETRVLKKPSGVQDYYPAIKPGLSCISFGPHGHSRKILPESMAYFLQDHLLLIDSKIKHHSGQNNWEIFKGFIEENELIQNSLKELAKISNDFKIALEAQDAQGLKSIFDREIKVRKTMSNTYFNKELSAFCNKLEALDEVLSYKVCGAGGGGCVLVLYKKGLKSQLQLKLSAQGIEPLPFGLSFKE